MNYATEFWRWKNIKASREMLIPGPQFEIFRVHAPTDKRNIADLRHANINFLMKIFVLCFDITQGRILNLCKLSLAETEISPFNSLESCRHEAL